MSPVHIKYRKSPMLVASHHRCNMVGLSLQDSDWIDVDEWECMQDDWTETRTVLQDHFQKEISERHADAKVMMVCGSDLLESFSQFDDDTGAPIWKEEDKQIIMGDQGVVCMTREGTDLDAVIRGSATLTQYKDKIVAFESAVRSTVSSTEVRNLLQTGKSVKYLMHERTLEYLKAHNLSFSKSES